MFNSKLNVNSIEWLDVVFANRNQSYGAFVLRKESGKYLKRAMFIATGLFCSTILLSAAYNRTGNLNPDQGTIPLINKDSIQIIEVDLTKKELPKPKEQKIKVSEPVSHQEEFNQIKYNQPRVVADNIPTIEIPTIADIDKNIIGSLDIKGKESGENSTLVILNEKGGNGNAKEDSGEGTYNMYNIEKYPQFPGGMDEWSKFLSKNLRYPNLARENSIGGRVIVSFVIETNGEITNLKILRGIGAGCDEEAIRVIKKSPFWSPGYQNGRAVRVSYIMPIVFRLSN
nr:energy transducer TonB [Pseudopedobacter sp.]